MEAIWQWGLALIVALQSPDAPLLDSVFRAITFLGEEEFYLLLFPALLWAVDARLGYQLGIIFLLSVYVNSVVKELFRHPRPFEMEPTVKLISEVGYGLPSGHAQNAVVIWGGVAAHVRKPWAWTLAVALAGLIGLSRVYLGVHFPTDVLAGWAIGAALLAIGLSARRRVGDRVSHWPLWGQLALGLLVPITLTLLFRDEGAVSATGALAGISTGLAVGHRHLRVTAEGPWWQRILRLVLGLIVLLVIYLGLKMAFPPEGAPLHLTFRFVRYAALGLWISLGAPWLFDRLRLMPRLALRPASRAAG